MNERNVRYPSDCREFDAANRELNAFIAVHHSSEHRQDQTRRRQGTDFESGCSCGNDQVTTLAVKDNIAVEGFPLTAGLGVPVLNRDE